MPFANSNAAKIDITTKTAGTVIRSWESVE
jgi:hypothetical protein